MFEVGQDVRVSCSVSPGPFPDERLVTVETVDGPISGFVHSEDLIEKEKESGFLAGRVVAWDGEIVTVRLRGSFFTTNGLADVARERLAA